MSIGPLLIAWLAVGRLACGWSPDWPFVARLAAGPSAHCLSLEPWPAVDLPARRCAPTVMRSVSGAASPPKNSKSIETKWRWRSREGEENHLHIGMFLLGRRCQ